MQLSRHHMLRLIALVMVWCALGVPTQGTQPVRAAGSVQVFVEPGAHLTPVLSLIRRAKHSIRLEVYLFTNRSLITELGRAERRGVNVRVLLEEHPFGSQRYAQLGYSLLRAAGVPVRWANERAFTYTHEKAMVVDNQIAGIFTFNLTSSGLYSNREFGVIDADSADAPALASIFDADWNRRTVHPALSHLVMSPINARHTFQTLIDGARHTLDLYAEEVGDASIEARLTAAARRHVRVRLITSATSAGVDALRQGGVNVDIMPKPYVHAKAIVADGARLFIGSENISATSLDRNREAGIELNDPGLAAVVERTFTADWSGQSSSSGTTAPPPTSTPAHAGPGLTVRVTATPTTVTRGRELTITAHTDPGAACAIRVTYPDGYMSRAASLRGTRTAGNNGTVSWSWRVGSSATGTAHAGVICRLGARTASGSVTFDIHS